MDFMKLGQDLLSGKMGDVSGIMDALTGLTDGKGLDLGGIADKLKQAGLADQVNSWLGDGENASVSGDQMSSALGEDRVGQLASKLGVESSSAADTLSQVIPGLLDKLSSGGSLRDGAAGEVDPMELIKGLFSK